MTNQIKKLLIHPKMFFRGLKEEKSYKKALVPFIVFSLLIYIFWFIKIILQVNNTPFYSGPSYYDFLFGNFGLFFTIYALVFLIADIIISLFFTLVIVALAKFICYLIKVKISLNKIWIISVYSLIAFVLASLFHFIAYFINTAFLKYVGYVFYAYYLVLLIIGIFENREK